jgi:hypothetical protein
MAGRGSLAGMLPYGDANEIVMDMARYLSPLAFLVNCHELCWLQGSPSCRKAHSCVSGSLWYRSVSVIHFVISFGKVFTVCLEI